MNVCKHPGCPIPTIFPPHRHDTAEGRRSVDSLAGALFLWDPDHAADAMRYVLAKECWKYGWLLRWGSAWVGAHWSKRNKRLCLNFLPFVTLWITAPGGKTPAED